MKSRRPDPKDYGGAASGSHIYAQAIKNWIVRDAPDREKTRTLHVTPAQLAGAIKEAARDE
jgi:hypothetical protein